MMGLNLRALSFHRNNKNKEGALHTDKPVFEFRHHTAEFPNQWLSMTYPSVFFGLTMSAAV